MTLGYAVQSMLEVAGLIFLIFAMIFDEKISVWEKRMMRRIKKRLFGTKTKVIDLNVINRDGRAV